MKNFTNFLSELKISLEYHDKLNPKLWVDDKLNPEVRKKLLEFIDAWRIFAKIPKELVQDIIMTGGNANYNYTALSDIDVHMIISRDKLGDDRAMVDDYLQDKKMLWTLTHDITILGYPLEPYAQDPSEHFHSGQGVYSLKNDKWVQKPEHGDYNWKNDVVLKNKIKYYMHTIDSIINDNMDLDAVDKIKERIRDMRGASILAGGELGFENLVFKELRNKGYLDKLNDYKKTKKDKELSL